jgi:hypothetical protein
VIFETVLINIVLLYYFSLVCESFNDFNLYCDWSNDIL